MNCASLFSYQLDECHPFISIGEYLGSKLSVVEIRIRALYLKFLAAIIIICRTYIDRGEYSSFFGRDQLLSTKQKWLPPEPVGCGCSAQCLSITFSGIFRFVVVKI